MPQSNSNEEQNQEEQQIFKIADRRKFNVDGTLREGVTLEDAAPKTQAQSPPAENFSASNIVGTAAAAASSEQTTAQTPIASLNSVPNVPEETEDDEPLDETNIPGADNPASFANFLLSLASQAAAALGLSENPMTGTRRVDLETSRYWLDVLGMLREKTSANLHPQEQKLFDSLLSDLRMQYVQMTRAAEAQLKKQAAQKFSGKDILGK